MTTVRAVDLSMSEKNSERVCLLKPNFSSRTNVWYRDVGRDITCWMIMKVKTKTMECVISPVNPAGA